MFLFHHWFLLLFFQVFSLHQLSLSRLFFVKYFVFVLLYREYYGFERAFFSLRSFSPCTPSTNLPQYREYYGFETAFFTLSRLYLTLLPDIWHNLVLSRLPWEPAVLHWRTLPICFLELHSVQQKVLVSRFYLCIKALLNPISTSPRFWTD